jgi:hypothetical protein
MAKANLGPEYLRAEDLVSGGVWCEKTLTVKTVHAPNTIKTQDKKLIEKPVIEFDETPKRLVLGTTNGRLLKYATGATVASELIGKRLTIYPAIGNWFGQSNVTTMRIRIPDGGPKPFVQVKNIGVDITGQTFAQTPPPVAVPVSEAPSGEITAEEAERIKQLELNESEQQQ